MNSIIKIYQKLFLPGLFASMLAIISSVFVSGCATTRKTVTYNQLYQGPARPHSELVSVKPITKPALALWQDWDLKCALEMKILVDGKWVALHNPDPYTWFTLLPGTYKVTTPNICYRRNLPTCFPNLALDSYFKNFDTGLFETPDTFTAKAGDSVLFEWVPHFDPHTERTFIRPDGEIWHYYQIFNCSIIRKGVGFIRVF